jgi:hypothetical protein
MEPLATVGELELHLQRDVDATTGQLAVTLASGAVRAYCGWDLARETTTFYITSDGGQLLTLPTLHLLSVDDVRAAGRTLDATTWPYSYSRKGQMWGTWARGVEYEIDVVHGYEPIPDLVKLVVLDLASKQLNNPEGLTSATVGQVSKTWATSAPPSAMSSLHERLLDRYSL